MHTLKEFLETSSIHGLAHISTARSKIAKCAWFVIVVACFCYAISLIHSSFSEWTTSPIATSITTHPIEKFKFPEVSICPPRTFASALKYDLMQVANLTLTEPQKKNLQEKAKELFNKGADPSFASSIVNIEQVFEGFMKFPKTDGKGFLIEMSGLKGNISSPAFGEIFSPSVYRETMGKQLHYKLNMTGFKEYMSETEMLRIEINTDSPDDVKVTTQSKYKMYLHRSEFICDEDDDHKECQEVSWAEAEAYCVAEGGHIASVTSNMRW